MGSLSLGSLRNLISAIIALVVFVLLLGAWRQILQLMPPSSKAKIGNVFCNIAEIAAGIRMALPMPFNPRRVLSCMSVLAVWKNRYDYNHPSRRGRVRDITGWSDLSDAGRRRGRLNAGALRHRRQTTPIPMLRSSQFLKEPVRRG